MNYSLDARKPKARRATNGNKYRFEVDEIEKWLRIRKKNEWNLCIKVRFEIKQLFFFEISGGLWSREYLSPIPETDM